MTTPSPLWSREAEQSMLGGLLLDNEAFDRVSDLATAADFFDSRHAMIFTAIAGLIGAREPADVITVHERLQALGQAEDCGGLVYLNALSQSVPSAANIRRYASLIGKYAFKRQLAATIDKAAGLVGQDGDPLEQLERVTELFASLHRRAGGTRAPRGLGEVLAQRAAWWQDLADGRAAPGISTGLRVLDTALGGGLKPGTLIVVGARPSVGKTALAASIAIAAANDGRAALILSQEMTAGDLADRFVATMSGVSLGRFMTGAFDGDEWARISDAMHAAAQLPIVIDDQPALTIHQIRAKARQAMHQHKNLGLVAIDYAQLLAAPAGADKRHHQLEGISRALKQLAKELDVCVLLLSQLNRQSTQRSDGGEPELSDLKESGALEEDADAVLLLHPLPAPQPDGTQLVLAKLAKNRQGPRGRFGLNFDGKTQRWSHNPNANVERRVQGGGQ